MKKRIAGTGCCLLDYLYTDIDFSAQPFQSFLSKKGGDGGLVPGQLVFASGLAGFSGMPEEECLKQLTGGFPPDAVNLGGPGVVAMVHASQVLAPEGWDITFSGVFGDDAASEEMRRFVASYPVSLQEKTLPGTCVPSTTVLSDPRYNSGAGERTFINRLGVADFFEPFLLEDDFFDAPLFLWGGTGLVPPLHRNLTSLVKRSKAAGGVNVVGTVYDFLNESLDPDGPWPLGDPAEPAYPWIDLLICDQEEAVRLSGKKNLEDAKMFLKESGCRAFIITRGADPLYLYTKDGIFGEQAELSLPVSPYVNKDLDANPGKRGDTTGCGDNFVGGVMVSLARQLEQAEAGGPGALDLLEAAVEGICSGGLALYTRGGCRTEQAEGETRKLLEPIRRDYYRNTLPGVLK